MPSVLYGFVYIPPNDSTCFSHGAFATIHGKLNSEDVNTGVLIMCNMNATFDGTARYILSVSNVSNTDMLSYPFLYDDIQYMCITMIPKFCAQYVLTMKCL